MTELDGIEFDILANYEDLDDLTLSQAMDLYEVKSDDDNYLLNETGHFDLKFDIDAFVNAVEVSENQRHGAAVTETDILTLQRNQESRNTRRNTSWGYKTFTDWRTARNINYPLMQFKDVLYCNADELDHMLCCFVIEVRRGDGKPYPPSTLYQICAAVSRYMKESGVINYNFLDGKDLRFLNFRKTLDARMKYLAAEGVGVQKKQAEPITPDMEEILWQKQQLGSASSQSLINTIFYYNCKLFGLRGLDEHRKLEVKQFCCKSEGGRHYIEFQGYTSKNFNGGLNQRKVAAKTIKHYSEPGHERSLFDIYKCYMDIVGDGPMYRRPLAPCTENELRFSSQPIGVNKLGTIIKTMCSEAGIEGTFSNHSGKRTCATSLFQAGIDEQLIMQRTGHRSKAVQVYKVPSVQQLESVSKVLDPPSASISVKSEHGNCENKENSDENVTISKKPKLENNLERAFINITNCTVNIQYEHPDSK